MAKKKAQTPMEELTKGYEDFIKGKQQKNNGKALFNQAIKKAVQAKKGRATK